MNDPHKWDVESFKSENEISPPKYLIEGLNEFVMWSSKTLKKMDIKDGSD